MPDFYYYSCLFRPAGGSTELKIHKLNPLKTWISAYFFTTNGYDPGVPEEKLEEIRAFGASLR